MIRNPQSPRHRTFILGILVVALWIAFPGRVFAAKREDWVQLRLSQDAIARGYTLNTPSGSLILGMFPNIANNPAKVTLVKNSPEISDIPAGWKLVSDVYEYDIKTKPVQTLNREAILVLKYTSTTDARRMMRYWDSIHRSWVPLRSIDLRDGQAVRAFSRLPYSKIAVFEESTTFEGTATWYRASGRLMSASTNNYPIGTKVRVTNIDNGKSIVVEVHSTWAGSEGRVIDLTRDAFAVLGRVGAGKLHVRTELVRPSTDNSAPTANAPAITAASAIVVDSSQDRMLWEKNLQQRPIASITKLMTALVVLDTHPDFGRELEYIADDNTSADGSSIELYPGDTLAFDEALKATLIASANNAAKLLSRTSVSSKAEFVKRMNKKAKDLKMNFTRFVEPTGLDSGNVSTPGDIAKLVEAAMKHPEIRRLTTTARDAISANTFGPKQERRIEYGNTNKLLGLPGLVGGKTGYLGIGNATFALKFVQGAKSRIVVILGSTDGRTRNEDMKNLALWALSQT